MRLASTARTVSFCVKRAHCISDYHKSKQQLSPNMRTAHLNIFKNDLPQLKNLNVSVTGTFDERAAQTCMYYVPNQSYKVQCDILTKLTFTSLYLPASLHLLQV